MSRGQTCRPSIKPTTAGLSLERGDLTNCAMMTHDAATIDLTSRSVTACTASTAGQMTRSARALSAGGGRRVPRQAARARADRGHPARPLCEPVCPGPGTSPSLCGNACLVRAGESARGRPHASSHQLVGFNTPPDNLKWTIICGVSERTSD